MNKPLTLSPPTPHPTPNFPPVPNKPFGFCGRKATRLLTYSPSQDRDCVTDLYTHVLLGPLLHRDCVTDLYTHVLLGPLLHRDCVTDLYTHVLLGPLLHRDCVTDLYTHVLLGPLLHRDWDTDLYTHVLLGPLLNCLSQHQQQVNPLPTAHLLRFVTGAVTVFTIEGRMEPYRIQEVLYVLFFFY